MWYKLIKKKKKNFEAFNEKLKAKKKSRGYFWGAI